MCGLPFTLEQIKASSSDEESIDNANAASISMTKANGGEDQLSVTYWMSKGINTFPIICAYGGMDSIVGIAQYAKLEKALDDYGIDHEYTYFKNQNHNQITKKDNQEAYDEFLSNINEAAAAAIA